MSRWLWGTCLLLLTLFCLLAAAWWWSPQLGERWLRQLASQQNLELSAVTLRPGVNEWHIPEITLIAGNTEIQVRELQIRFDLFSLMEQQVHSVHIQRLDIVDHQLLTSQVGNQSDKSGSAVSWVALWELLPTSSLLIEAVTLTSNDVHARGRVSLDTQAANLEASVTSRQLPATLGITARLDRSGGLGFIAQLEEAEPALFVEGIPFSTPSPESGEAFTIMQLGTSINLSGPTLELLSAFILGEHVSGMIQGAFQLTLPWPPDVTRLSSLTDLINAAKGAGGLSFELTADPNDAQVNTPINAPINGRGTALLAASGTGEVDITLNSGTRAHLEDPGTPATLVLETPWVLTIQLNDPADLAVSAGSTTLGLASRFNLGDQLIELTERSTQIQIERLRLNTQQLSSNGTLLLQQAGDPLRVRFDTTTINSRTSLVVTADHEISGPLLATGLPGWQLGYDLSGGQLHIDLNGQLDNTGLVLSGFVAVADASGVLADLPVFGLTTDLPVAISKSGELTVDQTTIEVSRIDVGFPLDDVRFKVSKDPATIDIQQLSAAVFGGQFQIERVRYQTNTSSALFDIGFDNIQLRQLLALQGAEVSGSGTLHGTMPISLQSGEPTVTAGKLTARPPGGHINYRGPHAAAAAANPGLALAARALQNFNYQLLEATVNYTPDGEMRTQVRLEGSSPDVENGRPIHFNVNLSENILTLLTSLRASEAMQERVQQRLSR